MKEWKKWKASYVVLIVLAVLTCGAGAFFLFREWQFGNVRRSGAGWVVAILCLIVFMALMSLIPVEIAIRELLS